MARTKKQRVDMLLVERGLVASRTRAQSSIMAGLVFSGDRRIAKSGETLDPDAPLELRGKEHPWASRGGLKLDHALDTFGLDVTDATCLDIGASTGGFTDVLLSRGARKVFAVDVGKGQLDWKLRQDDRVVVLEETNARYITADDIPDAIDLITCDVSFIGLEKVLPGAMAFCHPGSTLVALIKPQFQAGPDQVSKGGIVRNPKVHEAVCEQVSQWLNAQPGWRVMGVTASPITGAKGNREFLIAATKDA